MFGDSTTCLNSLCTQSEDDILKLNVPHVGHQYMSSTVTYRARYGVRHHYDMEWMSSRPGGLSGSSSSSCWRAVRMHCLLVLYKDPGPVVLVAYGGKGFLSSAPAGTLEKGAYLKAVPLKPLNQS